MDQREKTAQFRALHGSEALFVLPNCWDAISAKVLQNAGAKAVATASASVSWACGVRDGEGLSRDEMVGVVRRVCDGVDVPVSADMERGYGETAHEVKASIGAVIEAGAVGINIEDSLGESGQRPVGQMRERIAAARDAGNEAGIDIFINARADGFLLGGAGDDVLADTIERGNAWLDAGADCVFVPGVSDLDIMKQLVAGINGPVSMIVMDEKTPNLAQLQSAGIVRISTGPRTMQAVMGCLADAYRSVGQNGDFGFVAGVPGFAELQNL